MKLFTSTVACSLDPITGYDEEFLECFVIVLRCLNRETMTDIKDFTKLCYCYYLFIVFVRYYLSNELKSDFTVLSHETEIYKKLKHFLGIFYSVC